MSFKQIQKPQTATNEKDNYSKNNDLSHIDNSKYQDYNKSDYYSNNNNSIDFNFSNIGIFDTDKDSGHKPMYESGYGCIKCKNNGNSNVPNNVTRLKVGQPDDVYEHEANRVADQVMHMQEQSDQKGIEKKEKVRETVHTKPVMQRRINDGTAISEIPPIIQEVISSPGQPLDLSTRQIMESHFDHDFSNVRIHTDRKAIESAQIFQARAYTVGQDIVFGIGQYTNTREGERLIAHELTHVIQQNSLDSNYMIQMELIYGSGYPRPYKTDENEIRNAEAYNWSPASIDFRSSVDNSGGGRGINTFRGLLDYIAGKQQGSISELSLLGHSNREYFGLSGTVTGKDVIFGQNGLVGQQTIKDNMQIITSKNLHNRFADNAKIILYGCNAGIGIALLNSLSKAFKVCVHAFENEIEFCFKWKPITGNDRHIISRGWINYSPPDPSDPFGLRPKKPCDEYLINLHNLTPDKNSCEGVSSSKGKKEKES